MLNQWVPWYLVSFKWTNSRERRDEVRLTGPSVNEIESSHISICHDGVPRCAWSRQRLMGDTEVPSPEVIMVPEAFINRHKLPRMGQHVETSRFNPLSSEIGSILEPTDKELTIVQNSTPPSSSVNTSPSARLDFRYFSDFLQAPHPMTGLVLVKTLPLLDIITPCHVMKLRTRM